MEKKSRRPLRYGLALAFLLLGLLWFFNFGPYQQHGSASDRQQKITRVAEQSKSGSAQRGPTGNSAGGKMQAKDFDRAKAKKLVANALRGVANAKTYRMVMTTYLSSNERQTLSSFTVIRENSPTRGSLIRCDTISFDAATMKPIQGGSRTQITNEMGNWEMGEGHGKDGIAFLLKNNEDPTETVAMNNSYNTSAQTIESTDNMNNYVVADGKLADKPVLYVTESSQTPGGAFSYVYTVDAITGDLLSMGVPGSDSMRQNFELNPEIDESDFDIPKSEVVAPVSNLSTAQTYLFEPK